MSASGARLEALTKDLRVHWEHTKDYWSDEKSREFEHKYLEELFASVNRAVVVIDQLDKLIAKIKKDCE
jgi:thymidylate synthase